jgi:hypothetical protein
MSRFETPVIVFSDSPKHFLFGVVFWFCLLGSAGLVFV